MKPFLKRYTLGIALITIIIAAYYFEIHTYFTLDALQKYRSTLMNYVNNYYAISVGTYIVLYILSATLSLPFATGFTLIGGALFGSFFGGLYALIGATLGAFGAFLLTRYLIGDWVKRRYAHRLTIFYYNVKRYGMYYLFFVRVIPIFPYFLVNIAAAFLPISSITFLCTTGVGMIPVAFLYTALGNQASTLFSAKGVMVWRTLVILSALIVGIILINILVRKWRR